jgi:proliferating cell nuclear antigen
MLVKLENPLSFAKGIDIISDLVTEVRIKINEFGMSITAMDPANVAMVSFKVPKSAFSQFETGNEVLGVNLDNLKQILKRCSVGSSLLLEKKDSFLVIQIQDRVKRNFTLNLIEVESEEKEVPNLSFTSLVEISSVDLVNSIEDCSVVSDSCSFITKDGKFIIEAKSLNSAMSEFSGDEAKIEAENSKAKYSLEYLQKFMKAAKLTDKISLFFAEDHPLRIDFRNSEVELSFILAPRVENDD